MRNHLVVLLEQYFSHFKHIYTLFYTFFFIVYQKHLNNITQTLLPNTPMKWEILRLTRRCSTKSSERHVLCALSSPDGTEKINKNDGSSVMACDYEWVTTPQRWGLIEMLCSQYFYNKLQIVSCYWFKFKTNTKFTLLS